MHEDAAANAAGNGAVAGIGVGEKGEPGLPPKRLIKRKKPNAITETPDDTFAGADVFNVDRETFMKSRFGKSRYHRYSRYVGEGPKGEEIRTHGRSTTRDIIVKDEGTGAMVYLRRGKYKS